jgi:hypothetical protein
MEVRTSSRKRLSPQERDDILNRFRQSGLTQRQFAAQAGVSLSWLQSWLYRAPKTKPPSKAPRWLEVAPLSVHGSCGSGVGYSVELPNGISLKVPRGFCASELAALDQVLKSL